MKRRILFDSALVCVILFAGILVYNITPPTSSTNNLSTTMTTPTPGLTIAVLKEGTGPGILNGQTAMVDYTGKLSDGTVFDSSIPRGTPFLVHLGAGEVIQGWDLGLLGMKVGETRELTIAPELAYGKDGFPGVIPENATLTFEITLRAIQ